MPRALIRETITDEELNEILARDYVGDVHAADEFFEEPLPRKNSCPESWVRPVPQPAPKKAPKAKIPPSSEYPIWLRELIWANPHISQRQWRKIIADTLDKINTEEA